MRQFNRDRDIINSLQSYQPQPIQGIDWAGALNAYTHAKDKALDDSRREALAAALESGDQEQIDKAALAADPTTFYANRLAQAQRQQQRDWAVADREQEHQWDLEKLEKMNQNALGLAKAKAMLDGGQNGLSEFDKVLQREEAKNYAAELEMQRNLAAMQPKIESDVNRLLELSDKATYTLPGQFRDWWKGKIKGQTTEGAKARAEMENIVENNVLPQLRTLLGAQFTEREGERVKQTIMDPDRTPEERRAQLNNFLNSKIDALRQSNYKLQNYGVSAPVDSDPLGIL